MSSWDDDREYEQVRRRLREYLGWPDPEPEPWVPSWLFVAMIVVLIGWNVGLVAIVVWI